MVVFMLNIMVVFMVNMVVFMENVVVVFMVTSW